MKPSPNLHNASSDGDPEDSSIPQTGASVDRDGLNTQTCCSNCQTVFEVSLELLASPDTRVRCGECMSIFDALANLRESSDVDSHLGMQAAMSHDASGRLLAADESQHEEVLHEASSLPDASAAALAGLANDTSSLEITYSDFDLFSTEANLPEVDYLDQTLDRPSFDFDELLEGDAEQTFSDSLFVQDITVDARSSMSKQEQKSHQQPSGMVNDLDVITDDLSQEPLVFNYKEGDAQAATVGAPVHSPYDPPPDPRLYSGVDRQREPIAPDAGNPWVMRGALLMLVLLLAGGLYAYRERSNLQDSALIRPLLEATCQVFSCQLPARVDLAALRAVDRSVVTHPTIPNALYIKFGLVNQATFQQAYPVLQIRLTDRAGRLVVTNSFLPEQYLNDWQVADLLAVGQRREIGLSVVDPGNTAMSFELDFKRFQ